MRGKSRKGQAVFEFLIAAVFFFYIVFYVINYLNSTAVVFSNDFYMNSLEFKAFHVSEVLLHQEGKWSDDFPEAIGLSAGWPVLNDTRMQYFQAYCGPNKDDMLKKLDVNINKGRDIRIEINDSSGYVLKCGSVPMIGVNATVSANIKRFALSESGEILTMKIVAW